MLIRSPREATAIGVPSGWTPDKFKAWYPWNSPRRSEPCDDWNFDPSRTIAEADSSGNPVITPKITEDIPGQRTRMDSQKKPLNIWQIRLER